MSFFVYKSSAGSGKTYTLVREYLQLALASPDPDYFRHILAITFTNRAADEMKDRVLKKLQSISRSEKDSMFNELKKSLVLDDFQLAERAGNLLSHILHHYSDFSISTIDKFTHRVLSTFAHDMRLPVSFNVEVESDELLTEAIDILLQKAGSDETLTKTLVEFAESRAEEDRDWRIERSIFQLAKLLFDEEGHMHVDSLKNLTSLDFELVRKNIFHFGKQYENNLGAIAQQAIEQIAEKGISLDDFYQGKNGIGHYFRRISELDFDKIEGNSYVHKALGEGIWYTDKKPAEMKAAIDKIADNLIEAYQQIQDEKEKHHSTYLLGQLVVKNLYAVSVLTEVEKILNEIKTESNTVHISEFNRLISGVVMYEPAPFIYERIGQRYQHYLVDEFQDTSVMQWLNLLPLLDEALAKKHFSMVVGDGKQAIYRWRGGRVEQFNRLPQIFLTPALTEQVEKDEEGIFTELIKEREATLQRNIAERKLGTNFRSKVEIVNFNNDLFEFLSSKLTGDYRSIYESHRQQADEKNTGGMVSIDFIDTEDDYEQYVCEKTNSIIIELLADGFQLKDIAILTRKNTHASDVAKYLLEQNINVISSESLLLSQSTDVGFIISLLKYLYNTKDVIAEAECLYFLQKSVDGKLDEYLLTNYPQLNSNTLLKFPLYEVFEKMSGVFFQSQPNPYIQFFLDMVHSYTSRYNNDAGEFLQWWEEKKDKTSIVIPQGINAVNVMTIHKSKGLEFPVVIYPFADEEVDTKRSLLWLNLKNKNMFAPLESALVNANKTLEQTEFAVDYEEEINKTTLDFLNLLYVAFTRPVNRLYVLSRFPEKEKDVLSGIPYSLKGWLQEKEQWVPEKLNYTFGNQSAFVAEKKTVENAFQLSEFISSDWREKLLISRNSQKIWEEENSVAWGNLFHTAIASIFTQKDVQPVLSTMRKQGLVNKDQETELNEKINTLLERPDVKDYFTIGLNVKTETDILLSDGTWLRPDRVIINGNTATVIDFKTGRQNSDHEKQLALYAEKLMEMGFDEVEKRLIYTEHHPLQ